MEDFVKLTMWEILEGAGVGLLRQAENAVAGRCMRWGGGGTWETHIEGALGEMALSRYLGIPWGGVGQRGPGDVGMNEVRTTPLVDGALIMHPEDCDDRRYWLLTGRDGRYVVRGWIMGRDGKDAKWWRADRKRPAFFVEQYALNDPRE